MYVIETRRVAGLAVQTLHEMTKRDLAEKQRFETDAGHTWHTVSAERAHRFVRYGGVHTTGLWLDGARVRKAQACTE